MHARRILFLLLPSIALLGCGGGGVPAEYQPRDGDVVFQSLPNSPTVRAIEDATKSPYSHCGLVTNRDGHFVVIEAYGAVHETPLADWIGRGRGRAFAVYRFREPASTRIPEIVDAARRMEGKPYDFHYAMDDDAIYCSELIFKAFKDVTGEPLGTTQTLGELGWQPFVEVIKSHEDGAVPLDREMITPRALSEASQLEETIRFGW
jgi:uncharacterized protein YycO